MAQIRNRGNGHYLIMVSMGYDSRGKKLQKATSYTVDPHQTPRQQEKALQAFAAAFEAKVKNGLYLDADTTTLGEFAERWMEEYVRPNMQPATMVKYRQVLDDQIIPALGHVKLSKLRPHLITEFYNRLLKDGARKDGKAGGYSSGSIRKTHNVLSSILHMAVNWEVIESNPCGKVRVPSGPSVSENIRFFTPEQVNRFLDYIEQPYSISVSGHSRTDDTGKVYRVGAYKLKREVPEQIRVLLRLAIYSGLRKGEILALQWPDIDFDHNTLHVTKAVSRVKGRVIIKALKTKGSVRKITLPRFLITELAQLRESQEQRRLDLENPDWNPEGYLFTQENGDVMNYSTPYEALQDIIDRYNSGQPPEEQLPKIPFHGLRHTNATLLIAGQQDIRTVSARLGHAQSSTTLDIYAHALADREAKAANALDEVLSHAAEKKE